MPVTLQTPRTAVVLAAAFLSSSTGCQSPLMSSAANAFGARLPTIVMTESEEHEVGAQAYREILAQSKPTGHPEYQEIVERVGRRIANVAGKDNYQWEFRVLAGPTQNAFCLPGGKVAVYEGIFPICENEAGLAVVMSHEIAHALARHGGERMRNQALVDAVGEVVNNSTGDEESQRKLMIQGVYGVASQVGVILPFSRQHESEADSIGIMLMAKAGYEPDEAVRFWKRFQQANTAEKPELLSTHPSDERRAADLETLVTQAERIYNVASNKVGRGEALPKLGASLVATKGTTRTNPPIKPAAAALRTAIIPEQPATAAESLDPWLSNEASAAPEIAEPVENVDYQRPASNDQNSTPFEIPAAENTPAANPEAPSDEDGGWLPARDAFQTDTVDATTDEAARVQVTAP